MYNFGEILPLGIEAIRAETKTCFDNMLYCPRTVSPRDPNRPDAFECWVVRCAAAAIHCVEDAEIHLGEKHSEKPRFYTIWLILRFFALAVPCPALGKPSSQVSSLPPGFCLQLCRADNWGF